MKNYRIKQTIAAILAITSLSMTIPAVVFAEDDETAAVEQAVEFIRFTGKQKLEAGKSYYIDTKLAVVGNFTIPEGVYIEIREGGRLRTKSAKGRIFVKGEMKVEEGGTLSIEQGDITVYKGSSIEIAGEMKVAENSRIRSQGELNFTGTSTVSISGEMRLYKDGIMTVGGELTFAETATFKTSATVTVTETGTLDNQGTAIIAVSGSIQNSGEVKGNEPEGKPVEEIKPIDGDNSQTADNGESAPDPAPAPVPRPAPDPDPDPAPAPAPDDNNTPTPPPAPVYTGSLYHTEAEAALDPTNFALFNKHFPTAALRLRDAYIDAWQTDQTDADELDAAYSALERNVNIKIDNIFDPNDITYTESFFTPESWALFHPAYPNHKATYDASFTLIQKINFIDDATEIQDKLIYKGTPANHKEITEILLTYNRDSWFYTDTMNAFDALKAAEANLKIGADFDTDSADLAALCDTAYETFVTTLKSNYDHYLSNNSAFNLFKTETDVYLQSEYDYYIAISVKANPTIAEMTELMNAVNVERRTGVTVTTRTTPTFISEYTDFYTNKAAVTAASLADGMTYFTTAYETWADESSADNATILANAYESIEDSINVKYSSLISSIDEYDNPTGIVYDPTSLAALKDKFASYIGVNTTLLERAELLALRDAVKFKVIPSGLTVAEIEDLYGQSGLSVICTEYADYASAYEAWNGYYTEDTEDANEKAALVRSAYTALYQEIGGIFSLKQDDYETLAPKLAYGYYTKATADAFNANLFIDSLIAGNVSLSRMIDTVLNYDSEKSKLAPAPHPEMMILEGNNLTIIIDLQKSTTYGVLASAYKDAFDVWDLARKGDDDAATAAALDAANTAYAALVTNGIDKDLTDTKAAADAIINNVDNYAKDYRDSLSTNMAEGSLREKVNKIEGLKYGLENAAIHTYEARWAYMTTAGDYNEYIKSLGYTWENENDKDEIRDIVDGIDTSYQSHPDVSYSYGFGLNQTFIGAQNVVLDGKILQSPGGIDCYIVVVYESSDEGTTRENVSKWAYVYSEQTWYALSGNNTNFAFALKGDNFNYTITVGTFNEKTYITGEADFDLPDGNWTIVSAPPTD
jgi:hypothetical protein